MKNPIKMGRRKGGEGGNMTRASTAPTVYAPPALRPPRPPGNVFDVAKPGSAQPTAVKSKASTNTETPSIRAMAGPDTMSREDSQKEALRHLQKLRMDLLGERKQEQVVSGATKSSPLTSSLHRPSAPSPPPQSPYSFYDTMSDILRSPLSYMSTDQMLGQINDDTVNGNSRAQDPDGDNDEVSTSNEPKIELQINNTGIDRRMSSLTHGLPSGLLASSSEYPSRGASRSFFQSAAATAKAVAQGGQAKNEQGTQAPTPKDQQHSHHPDKNQTPTLADQPWTPSAIPASLGPAFDMRQAKNQKVTQTPTPKAIDQQHPHYPKKNQAPTLVDQPWNPSAIPASLVSAFDMQKSLEKQLEGLPGARLPGTSIKSFDDHSFIVSSGKKSLDIESKTESQQQKQLNEMVAVVPSSTFSPNNHTSVIPPHELAAAAAAAEQKPTKRLPKRLPRRHRADTVRIDKGLRCVDPNNLKPQMQEILQKKQKEEMRAPERQVGMIVESVDLVDHSKPSGMMRLGSKLKDSFSNAFSRTSSSPRRRRRTNDDDIMYRNTEGGATNSSIDERLWVKQTIEQQNYKITKVLGSEMQNMRSLQGGLQTNRDGSGTNVLTPEFDPVKSHGESTKSENDMEIFVAAEGKKPVSNELARGDTVFDEDAAKKQGTPLKGIIKAGANMARRLKQKEMLTSMAKELMDKKAEALKGGEQRQKPKGLDKLLEKMQTQQQSHALRIRIDSTDPTKANMNYDLPEDLRGSFCNLDGSPSLESLNTYAFNQNIADALKILAEHGGHLSRDDVEIPAPVEQKTDPAKEKHDATKKETSGKQAKAIQNAKVMMLFSLKQRIIRELKKQKVKEHEAALRGERISDAEKEKQLDVVRRLHLRREALQQLSDEDIMEAFNRTAIMKEKGHQKEGFESGGGKENDDKAEPEENIRKSVHFARQSTAASSEDGDDDFDEDDYPDMFSEETNQANNSYGFMSWASCGAGAESACAGRRPVMTEAQAERAQSLRDAAMKAVDLAAREGFMKAHTHVKRNLSCGTPPSATRDIDDCSRASSVSSIVPPPKSQSSKPRRIRGEKEKGAPDDSLNGVLSHSGSLASGGSRGSFETRDTRETRDTLDTRDTRATEFTSETRETYDSRGTYDTRDSYYTYDTPDSYRYYRRDRDRDRHHRYRDRGQVKGRDKLRGRPRSRPPPRKGGRSYQHSIAGTDFLSEYTEDTFEGGLLNCGGQF